MTYRALCIGGCADGQWHSSHEKTARFSEPMDMSPVFRDHREISITMRYDAYRLEQIFRHTQSGDQSITSFWLVSGMTTEEGLQRLCEHYRPPVTTVSEADARVCEAIQHYDAIMASRLVRDADGYYRPEGDIDLMDDDCTIEEAMKTLRRHKSQ